MSKIRFNTLPDGRRIADVGTEPLSVRSLEHPDLDFLTYYTSGFFDLIEHNKRFYLVEKSV